MAACKVDPPARQGYNGRAASSSPSPQSRYLSNAANDPNSQKVPQMNILRMPRLLASAACLLIANPMFAAPLVRYEVNATVDFIDDPNGLLTGLVQLGDPLTGILQYDLALPDTDASPTTGFYEATSLSENFIAGSNVGGEFFETLSLFDVFVDNDVADVLEFFASGDTIPSTLAVPGIGFVDLQVILVDDEGTALSSDALPTNLNLADFESAVVVLSADCDTSPVQTVYLVEATINSIRQTAIPEPHSLALLALGAAVASGSRRRPKQ